jgi:cobalamin-dependent methionine synthase I
MDGKVHHIIYKVGELKPYINWPYFDYAWGVGSKGRHERTELRREADAMLVELEGRYSAHALFGIFTANSDGDDILVDGIRIPMLRQQHASGANKTSLCLADFVRPLSMGVPDEVGVFATTVDAALEKDFATADPYRKMMAQTLADRLAEAAAEKMHQEVRTSYWGYAPDERLTIQQLHIEAFQGIRPAVGYPSLPDTSVNFILSDLLDMKQIGIRLTESGMMMPHASVSGLMIAHPKARYFNLGKIGEDQLRDYAARRGVPVELMRRFLSNSLIK